MKHIQELFSKAKEYGDDKVQLAIQTYELVDKHIRRLDSDLARFEGEIHDKAMTAKDKTEESVGKSKSQLDSMELEINFLTWNHPEGRKKTKDAKVTGKKKRAASDDEEKVEEKAAVQQKSSKKQKVNQEKEGRKAQKVIHQIHQLILRLFFAVFNFFSLIFY